MSSQNQTSCETTPLLGDTRLAGRSSTSLLKERFRFSPETLLIPLVIATRLGSAIPSTTLGELLRQTVCRLSNTLRGDPASFVQSPYHPGLCDSPQVVRDFATVGAVFGVIGGITSEFALVTVMVTHRHRSIAWLWHLESYFTALWEETPLFVHTHCGDHVELPDTRFTIYARRPR